MRTILIALAVICISGCLNARQKAATADFATTTRDLAMTTKGHFTLVRRETTALVDEMLALGLFVEIDPDGNPRLQQVADRPADPFGVDRDGRLSADQLRIRIRTLDALEQYGRLLQALVSDGSSAAALRDAASNTIAAVRTIDDGLLAQADGDSVIEVVSTVGGWWIEKERAEAVRVALASLQPAIDPLIAAIREDLGATQPTGGWSEAYHAAHRRLIGFKRTIDSVTWEDALAARAALTEAAEAVSETAEVLATAQKTYDDARAQGSVDGAIIDDLEAAQADHQEVTAAMAESELDLRFLDGWYVLAGFDGTTPIFTDTFPVTQGQINARVARWSALVRRSELTRTELEQTRLQLIHSLATFEAANRELVGLIADPAQSIETLRGFVTEARDAITLIRAITD